MDRQQREKGAEEWTPKRKEQYYAQLRSNIAHMDTNEPNSNWQIGLENKSKKVAEPAEPEAAEPEQKEKKGKKAKKAAAVAEGETTPTEEAKVEQQKATAE